MNNVVKSKAERIRFLLGCSQRFSNQVIAETVGCKPRYVAYIKWASKASEAVRRLKKISRARNPEHRNNDRAAYYKRGCEHDCFSHYKPYERADDKLIMGAEQPDIDIARQLGRTVSAIQLRRYKLRKQLGVFAPTTGKGVVDDRL